MLCRNLEFVLPPSTLPAVSPTSTLLVFHLLLDIPNHVTMSRSPFSLPLPRPVGEGQGGTSIVVSLPAAPMPQTSPSPPQPAQTPARPSGSLSNRKPGVLPANLEEMKVPQRWSQRRRRRRRRRRDLPRVVTTYLHKAPLSRLCSRATINRAAPDGPGSRRNNTLCGQKPNKS